MYVKTDVEIKLAGMPEIAAEELNVKKITRASEEQSFITYELKPQLKTLGPKYGALLGQIRNFLTSCNAAEVVAAVKNGGTYRVELGGKEVEFAESDLLISTKSGEGFSAESDGKVTVAIDTTLTPALIDEGYARELVSKVQTMRKEAGFEVTDHIKLGVIAEESFKRIVEEYDVLSDVLADEVSFSETAGYTKEYDLGGKAVTLSVCRI